MTAKDNNVILRTEKDMFRGPEIMTVMTIIIQL